MHHMVYLTSAGHMAIFMAIPIWDCMVGLHLLQPSTQPSGTGMVTSVILHACTVPLYGIQWPALVSVEYSKGIQTHSGQSLEGIVSGFAYTSPFNCRLVMSHIIRPDRLTGRSLPTVLHVPAWFPDPIGKSLGLPRHFSNSRSSSNYVLIPIWFRTPIFHTPPWWGYM